MLGFHELHLSTFSAGDVINIFATVKVRPWQRPW